MKIQITKRHMVGGQGHEHIAEVQWIDSSNGETGKLSREAIVRWLDDKTKNNVAIVNGADGKTSWVGTVHPTGNPAFIRTYADGDWNNNLLSLDTY
jgi:hypothetical protein